MADNRERYAAVGTAFLGKIAQRLQNLDVEKLSAGDVARWAEVAMKLERAGQIRRLPEGRREEYLSGITRDMAGDPLLDLGEYDEETGTEGEQE